MAFLARAFSAAAPVVRASAVRAVGNVGAVTSTRTAAAARPTAVVKTIGVRCLATGTVKWFNVTRGYGFIVQDDDESDIFVHQTAVLSEGFRFLNEGERVSYDVVETDRGPQASNVTDEMGNRFNRDAQMS